MSQLGFARCLAIEAKVLVRYEIEGTDADAQ